MFYRSCLRIALAPGRHSTRSLAFSATGPAKVAPQQSSQTATKNTVMALALLGFTGGVYYTAINKMRPGDDDLGRVISEMNPNSKK
jgi:hypothetical protein